MYIVHKLRPIILNISVHIFTSTLTVVSSLDIRTLIYIYLHRLSQTTSSATTSSSEGRGRREASPEDRRTQDLHLPDLDRPLPVYDIQYGVSVTYNSTFSWL